MAIFGLPGQRSKPLGVRLKKEVALARRLDAEGASRNEILQRLRDMGLGPIEAVYTMHQLPGMSLADAKQSLMESPAWFEAAAAQSKLADDLFEFAERASEADKRIEAALADQRWRGLKGGYRTEYDPRSALAELAKGVIGDEGAKSAWDELWNELHHQGDVGEASYAAVPVIIDLVIAGKVQSFHGYALPLTIEQCRLEGRKNPPLPGWLRPTYEAAWPRLFKAGLTALPDAAEEELTSSIIAVLAHCRGLPNLARIAADSSEQERADLIQEAGWL